MDNIVNRATLFSVITGVLVTPAYLALKLGMPGILFLYAPLVGFLGTLVLAAIESDKNTEQEEQ